jgi:mitogen-activated protein kinase 1/3
MGNLMGTSSSSTACVGKKADAGKPQEKPRASISLPSKPKHKFALPDNYVTADAIGSGSYGSVVMATDTKKNRQVAVKRIENLFEELTDCKRILREFALLQRLEHPHVIALYDFVIPQDLKKFQEVYIIMEICDSDLKKLVKTDVVLEIDHIKTLMYGLLAGCRYLHSAGVIHRDLKPANVLCNRDCTVKVCDFGLSRTLPPDQLHIEHKDDEGVPEDAENASEHPVVPATYRQKKNITKHVVTRWYRAPEVILKEPRQTAELDVWSCGCIFAELLQMLEGYHFYERGPLFPGHSCFPLSPAHGRRSAGGQARGKYDQLMIILGIVGTPSADEVNRLTPGEGKTFLQSLSASPGKGIKSRLSHIPDDCLDLLTSMLRFGIMERSTVQRALDHPLLQSVRKPGHETTAASPIQFPFDTDRRLDEPTLRQYFGEEKARLDARATA